MKFRLLMAAVLTLFTGAAHAGEAAVPKGDWRKMQEMALAENLKKPGWAATPSGLQYHPIKRVAENQPMPRKGAEVAVHYAGTLINGTEFDSSYKRAKPAVFPLDRVIKGWGEGVPMMRVGETWEFLIPANLAYGDKDGGSIPAGSALFFKVELLAIKPGDEAK
jgi:FKBP-type peptidyl-prolyl cis-trans isomerase FkpA